MSLDSMLNYITHAMFALTVASGAVYAYDRRVLARRRQLRAQSELAAFDSRHGAGDTTGRRALLQEQLTRQPAWVEWTAGFFPVLAVIFTLRAFFYEPFAIPSASMQPLLMDGDRILVNKFAYGLRLPLINTKILDVGTPRHGEVMVFRLPSDPSINYIKRVVGLPGDRVVYADKRLTVNGQAIEQTALPDYADADRLRTVLQKQESAGGHKYRVLHDPAHPPYVLPEPGDYPNRSACQYDARGFACTVPSGHYFMMGDNRDNSVDSRYWGFVPEANIVGRASLIWMNFAQPGRIGTVL
ncbi:MAG TPA: signal peptidase I [Burkholderiaceae bacterium]